MLSLMEVYSMTDLRALITQLCDELDHNRQCLLDDRRLTHPLSDKARAALVETNGPAVSGDSEPASVAKQCSGELSPAAQAVLDAVEDDCIHPDDKHRIAAAALRAAADQVVPKEHRPPRRGVRPGGTDALTPEEGAEDQRSATRRRFLAIATELEGAQ